MKVRILVCGGRTYGHAPDPFGRMVWNEDERFNDMEELASAQRTTLRRVLYKAKEKYEIECIIQGGAKGADYHAKMWAIANKIPQEEYKANWDKHGKKAGILRNQVMINEGKPTLGIAFAGGVGTADMVSRLRKAGIKVIEVPC